MAYMDASTPAALVDTNVDSWSSVVPPDQNHTHETFLSCIGEFGDMKTEQEVAHAQYLDRIVEALDGDKDRFVARTVERTFASDDVLEARVFGTLEVDAGFAF